MLRIRSLTVDGSHPAIEGHDTGKVALHVRWESLRPHEEVVEAQPQHGGSTLDQCVTGWLLAIALDARPIRCGNADPIGEIIKPDVELAASLTNHVTKTHDPRPFSGLIGAYRRSRISMKRDDTPNCWLRTSM